ncbi:endonuclease [Bifidobacterium xylocopae]|uniref:Endonuclease n=2 Tax=Bifidobacterium xylocopae TaxID=2493119 RepID=A0A366KGD4_9BIFI|nr:endonuclease [Bifidobacterium xylocopae]
MALRYLPAGWDWHRPLPELIALVPFLSAPIMIVLAWALVVAAWPQAVAATLLLTLEAVWALPFLLHLPKPLLALSALPASAQPGPSAPAGTADPDDPAASLTLMTLNCKYGHADAKAIVSAVRQRGVDLLALQEVSTGLLERLHANGLDALLPYGVSGPATRDDNGGFNALFCAIDPRESSPQSVPLPASAVPTMTLPALGGSIVAASAHPKSPQRGGANWGSSIQALAGLSPAAPSTPARASARRLAGQADEAIIMGDLNSSLFHPSFRRLLADGRLLDGAVALHRGLYPTFPASYPIVPPMIEIDHVLLTPGLSIQSLHAFHIPSTDHQALLAKIVAS